MGEVAGAHQVAAGQEFVGREDAVQGIAGDAQGGRVTGTDTDEDGVKTHFGNHLFEGKEASDQRIAFELDAQLDELVDFGIDHRVGQAEIRDAVFQHAAGLVEGLEHGNFAAGLGHIRRAGHACRAGADDADLVAVLLDVGEVGPAFADRRVTDKAFESADGHRFQRLADGTFAFALVFLWADAATDGRQEAGLRQDVVGTAQILLIDFLDEAGDVDADRTARNTGLVGTHQAAFGFALCVLGPVTAGHFLKVFGAYRCLLFGHRSTFLGDCPDGFFLRHD